MMHKECMKNLLVLATLVAAAGVAFASPISPMPPLGPESTKIVAYSPISPMPPLGPESTK
jgi:hypothetical protein